MIKVIACSCGSSDSIARKTLMNAGIKGWDKFPITKGKLQCRKVLDDMQRSGYNITEVRQYLDNHSSFVVVLGYSAGNPNVAWADAAKADIQDKLRAQALVKAFAQ